MLRVLNLGAGVQSSCILLKSCCGELPKLDAAVFADTQWEPQGVYQQLGYLATQAGISGIPLVTITKGSIRADSIDAQVRGTKKGGSSRWASMPIFTKADGQTTEGRIRRQCTSEYKIELIEKWIRRELLGLKHGQRAPKEPVLEQWFGISFDESHRASPPRGRRRKKGEPPVTIKWKWHTYPLLDLRLWPDGRGDSPDFPCTVMTRLACQAWLLKHHPSQQFVRSACSGCPYHSDAEWMDMKTNRPEEWADVCEFDRRIRNSGGMRGQMFLHRSCVPLEEVRFADAPSLFGEECGGVCGV